MPKFTKDSLTKLSSCHPDLQRLFSEVIKNYDCKILEGYRSPEDQLKAFNAGRSQIKSGGKHNNSPSLAVDVAPLPLDWNDKNSFYHFAGYVRGVAQMMKIKIRWGGDWNSNNDLKDQTFFDLPHFELVGD